MNNTLLAVIGGALLLGLVALGLTSWGSGNANGASGPMWGAMAQGQAYYNAGPMGPGMMGSMMQGRGSMGPAGNMGNTYGWGCGMGGMHSNMMRPWSGMGHMQGGMMGGGGHCRGMQTGAPLTPQQPQGETQK